MLVVATRGAPAPRAREYAEALATVLVNGFGFGGPGRQQLLLLPLDAV